MDSKPFWASKTLIVNVLAGFAAVAGAFGIDAGLDPEAQAAIATGALAVINIILRFITKAPVTVTRGE